MAPHHVPRACGSVDAPFSAPRLDKTVAMIDAEDSRCKLLKELAPAMELAR